ncbi:MerR family transcriptional regulator [Aldersonia sp. NBC_00410]|uniref:MerR family transcriptional regulator n=1 Tax=Aldersonia sp. NBC_00410 TaxID=2975954 RepID=UPI002253DCA9|nr:MerR family transcriptional regulator [Aldersonia sp. NBC_00410]MCX5041788.1 MerR family transcriptional regulator [Aldersonia sp. NBC_00410]
MRVSELVAATGVPLASVKFYLREGLLMPGAATSATRAEYGDEHIRRLRLIKSLTSLGLPVAKVRVIIEAIDAPTGALFDSLGTALSALPPYPDGAAEDPGDEDALPVDYPRARAALGCLGQTYTPTYPAVAQLEHALETLEQIGIPMSEEKLRAYGRHVRGIAEADLAEMPTDSPRAAIEYAVLGTVCYEPVIAAMWRLAHQDLAARTLTDVTRGPAEEE